MAPEYSVAVCKQLEQQFHDLALHRPLRMGRYDAGRRLTYEASSIDSNTTGTISLLIERFVGGGFAGQVYRVLLEKIEGGSFSGLQVGGRYAMKILIPPAAFSVFFRNTVYAIGFQAPFQLQTNPTAARCGALWQKFFRRGAKISFGDEQAVNNIHVTFIDEQLGSCGELSDWVDGRTWRLEVDDHMDVLKRWKQKRPVKMELLGSPEFRAKKEFMYDFVELVHDMGGHEFARQYAWSTCKSQPNCLKRTDAGDGPAEGLTAVDFRAGLALLPVLPMSPGDFSLIGQGLMRGSLVQFDRGNTEHLKQFISAHAGDFTDMRGMYDELVSCERIYRDSQPDITHNHLRLLYDRRLWRTILAGTLAGWRITGTVDRSGEQRLRARPLLMLLLFLCSFIPLAGSMLRRLIAHSGWRRHFTALIKPAYLMRALRGKLLECITGWHRTGRVDADTAVRLAGAPARAFGHMLLSFLPIGLHKLCTDWAFARSMLAYIFVRPVRLYFDPALREQWLRDMVSEGRAKHIISNDDAEEILGQLDEPFIQKYLKSLAVHVCTLPVTQVVSVSVAIIYVLMTPGLTTEQAWLRALAIIATFQVVPISPGSLVRGLYVLYLVVRERNFKDYNIAVFLGFFKYIGYLAFPIQMAYRYPTLARFMAAHWATDAVPVVPVFGESGALLEHAVFCIFYNWPLTIRRRMQSRMQQRAQQPARTRHIPLCILAAACTLHGMDAYYVHVRTILPSLRDVWWISSLVPLLAGSAITLWSGGAALSRRIISAALAGLGIGLAHTACTAMLLPGVLDGTELVSLGIWRIFAFTIFTPIGAILNELSLADPEIK